MPVRVIKPSFGKSQIINRKSEMRIPRTLGWWAFKIYDLRF